MDSNPVCHPSPAKKKNAHFWITFNFWWLAGLVNGLEPCLPPLSNQKNKMLVFGLHSTSDDRLGWSMDSNPVCHPSPAKKIKCSFLDYIQLLMISRAGQWTRTPSATPLQQKNKMLVFGLCSTSDDRPGWSMDSNPICHPSPAKKLKCSFLDYIQLLMIGRPGRWTRIPSATPLQAKKNKMLVFGLRSTSNDWPGWSMDLNPICHPSPAKKIKCLFLDYVQLLMIGQVVWWTRTVTEMQKKAPLSHHKMKCSFLDYVQLLIIGWAGPSHGSRPRLPKAPLSQKTLKCSFLDYIQLLMIGQAIWWWKLMTRKNEMLFQLGSSVVSVWVFCIPPPPDAQGRK